MLQSLLAEFLAIRIRQKLRVGFINIFEIERPERFELFRQPSGLIEIKEGEYIANPEAETSAWD